MKTALAHVEKPVRKLCKSLKNLPEDPPIEAVHDLRTNARRFEAMVAALELNQKNGVGALLKAIKRVRKAAGAVRDMDVLAGDALTLSGNRRDESVLCLLQHLEAKRTNRARDLLNTVEKQRKDLTRGLKKFLRKIENRLQPPDHGRANQANTLHSTATDILMNELIVWPPFSPKNLHAFRIKVKELRYVQQLADSADAKLLGALDRAKDRIGDWHDWQQLAEIGERTLDAKNDLATLEKIKAIGDKKLKQALTAAQELKRQALHVGQIKAAPGNRSLHPRAA
ncbi:MAG: CHAD domain-containing protein [Terracidiphilus sp.]